MKIPEVDLLSFQHDSTLNKGLHFITINRGYMFTYLAYVIIIDELSLLPDSGKFRKKAQI
jgi:hypothetical protein